MHNLFKVIFERGKKKRAKLADGYMLRPSLLQGCFAVVFLAARLQNLSEDFLRAFEENTQPFFILKK